MRGSRGAQKSGSVPSAKAHTSISQERLTQERVRELFDYREDGCLIRREDSTQCKAGEVAGAVDRRGYYHITLYGVHYYVHRLVWLWHHGYLPEHNIDHADRCRSNNRIENLREVTQSCNLRNTGNRLTNTSGVKGVRRYPQVKKWQVQIMVAGKNVYLGLHEDFLEAVCHRLAAEQAENWAGCDSCSPAYQYVQQHIVREK